MMNMKTTTGLGTMVGTVAAPIAWGSTYLVITTALPGEHPLWVAALRVAPAGLLLLAVGWWRSRWWPSRRAWRDLAVLATFNVGLFFPLLVVAAYRLPGGVAAAFGGLQPLLVLGLTRLLSGETPRRLDLVVGAGAAVGVALVALRPGAEVDVLGLLAVLGATTSFAVGVVLTRRYGSPADRVMATGAQLVLGALVLVPAALVSGAAPPAPGARSLMALAYLSLVATGLAFVLWFDGIRRLPAATPPLLGLANPVTGATLGWVLLHQSLGPTQLAGFALTIGAIAHGARRGTSLAGQSASVARPTSSSGVGPRMRPTETTIAAANASATARATQGERSDRVNAGIQSGPVHVRSQPRSGSGLSRCAQPVQAIMRVRP